VEESEASERELIAIVEVFNAAWNAHDLDAIMSFFTDDAVLRVLTPPSSDTGEPSPFNVAGAGKQQIRDMAKGFLPGYHLEWWGIQASENKVTLHYRNSADILRNLGLEFIEGTAEFEFEGKKIKNFYSTLSQETVQKMWGALGEQSSNLKP
jgi:hypothetical protein